MGERTGVMNRAFLAVLMGMQDVVGRNTLATLLRRADLGQYTGNFPPKDGEFGGHPLVNMSRLHHTLYDVHGPSGAPAILRRVGRAQWNNGLQQNAVLAGSTRMGLRFLPRRKQIQTALQVVAATYGDQFNTKIEVGEEGDAFFWQDRDCALCIDWKSDKAVCHSSEGFVQGIVVWAIESEQVKVEEVLCRAKGDPVCRHRITLTG